ncbi:MAG: bifunctional metallophosphatase/5'-nucleotidase [Faecousia sp.]
MKKVCLRLGAFGLCLVLLVNLFVPVIAAQEETVTVLFTHDLHSHFLPTAAESGGTYGGYARLMTAIREQRAKHPDALLLDGGDFSMGSLFQTAYAESALELRIMGAMGYDVTTFGNHEFDYLPKGLASMLHAAVDSGDDLPQIVDCNYLPPMEGEEGYNSDAALVWEALDAYGVGDFAILERGGVVFAVFGLTGFDSDDCAPNSGMILEDPAAAAQRTVDEAVRCCRVEYGVEPIVIALSHSGNYGGKGEDYDLAKAVTGIDLIISAHSHTVTEQPIEVGDTWIVSAGEYGKYLGVVTMERDGTCVDFELIPIDETVADDPEISALVEQLKTDVEVNYLSDYGMTFDQVLTYNPYEFDSPDDTASYAHESTLGNVFSDAYKWAVEKATGETVDLALTAAGVIRETIPVGNVTVSDIFSAASLGVGTEGELVSAYLTGADLKTVLEVDASVYPLMHYVQLFCSGVEYSFNTNRMIFNKVDYAMLRSSDGTLQAIEDDQLYHVVAGMYMAQMLGMVESTSFGLLTITLRDADGNPIDPSKLEDCVVRDENGVPVKEWYAIASYLDEMGGKMDEYYAKTDGRKVVYSSWNPVKLLRAANRFTWILIGVVILLAAIVVLIVRVCVVRRKKKNMKRA